MAQGMQLACMNEYGLAGRPAAGMAGHDLASVHHCRKEPHTGEPPDAVSAWEILASSGVWHSMLACLPLHPRP